MTTTACIVQARLGSTRLPAKILLPLPTERTVLEEVLHRCRRIPGVDVVVAAIPDTPENDILLGFINRSGQFHAFRGPEHDVLARYAKAAEAVNAGVIMRITADCPLIDVSTCGQMLAWFKSSVFDYASNSWPAREFPQGWDCEIFTRDTLMRAHEAAIDPSDREHVCPHMQRNENLLRGYFKPLQDRSHLRWTLDTLEDYIRIWGVFEQQILEAA